MELKKNQIYEVNIIDNGFRGEGIAKIDGFTIFVQNAIKGERVRIKILKVLSSHAFAKIEEILEKSDARIVQDCSTYSRCGGCVMRHISYDKTLEIKRNAVIATLKKQGICAKVENVIGMEKPYFYRNKLQYPIGNDSNGSPVMGVFAERSHRIVATEKCYIQNQKLQEIANDIFDFIKINDIPVYDEKTLSGEIRHLVLRIGIKTNEIMVIIVSNRKNITKGKELVSYIIGKYPQIKTIVKNINNRNTNVILGTENEILYGDGYIYDYLLGIRFKISPMSFYQVNPYQTEKLYLKAIEYASLSGNETVFDLYCGIGTIGICAAKRAGKLYGVETVPQAIEDARMNAKENGIENAEFYVGDVEKFLPEFIKENKIQADVVFIDPPRKGCDKIVLSTIMEIAPQKIVYVSCNPATLSRDLKILENKYQIMKITPVDLFPFTRTL